MPSKVALPESRTLGSSPWHHVQRLERRGDSLTATLGNECHQNLSFRNIFVHDETGGILSDGPNVADFLRLDINEV